jgi:hypothetical protein
MHPKHINHLEDAVKIKDENFKNSIFDALNRTGYDLEDLSALTCISKFRLLTLCNNDIEPTSHERYLISSVLPDYKE